MGETWKTIQNFTDIKFEKTKDSIARITINRLEEREIGFSLNLINKDGDLTNG